MNALTRRIDTCTALFKGTRTVVTVEEKAAEKVLEEVAGAGGEVAGESITVASKVARFCKSKSTNTSVKLCEIAHMKLIAGSPQSTCLC